MPFQLVNDSSTEAIAGNQTRTSSVGTMVISVTTARSRPDSLRTRFLRAETGAGGAPPEPVSGRGTAVGWAVISGREDRLLLALYALRGPVDVLGVLDELLQRRDHHRRREVGAGVAVEELGDLL